MDLSPGSELGLGLGISIKWQCYLAEIFSWSWSSSGLELVLVYVLDTFSVWSCLGLDLDPDVVSGPGPRLSPLELLWELTYLVKIITFYH